MIIGSDADIDRKQAAGVLTVKDASEVRAFSRFLQHVSADGPGSWERAPEPIKGQTIEATPGSGHIIVPEDWKPYVMGTGPAPDPLT